LTNLIQKVRDFGQSIWYDNISRDLLASGELARLIELGVSGVTSNPTIFEKAIAGSPDYDEALIALGQANKNVMEIYEGLVVEDIRSAADLLLPMHHSTNAADGYVSLEVSPALAYDTKGTIAEAERLFAILDRPNIMIKVPATSQGIPAIRRLIGEGINVNVTLIFSIDVYKQVLAAYLDGLEDLVRSGGNVSKVASVASFFVSRVDTAVDTLLGNGIRQGSNELTSLLGKSAVGNAKLAYQVFLYTFNDDRFAKLRSMGARVQRPLWASTGTKNPAYSDVMYVESLIGPNTVNTMPPATLIAFLEHGQAQSMLTKDMLDAEQTMERLTEAGVSMEDVTDRLRVDGVKSFADSFNNLINIIEEKKAHLLGPSLTHLDI
jgi:transaldolase/glucose-6-phosphate isomerase